MSLTEFDEKEYIELVREEGREEGLQEGHEKGLQEGREKGRLEGRQELASLINLLLSNNKIEEAGRVASDPAYCDQMLKQYPLV